MPPLNPPEFYCPPSTSASGWQFKKSHETGEVIPYCIRKWKAPGGDSKTTLFIHLGPLKPEHRHWPSIQSFPLKLVREVVDNMLKEKEDVRLNEMD